MATKTKTENRLSPITIEDCRLIFRNFTGKEGLYNREGERSFSVILPEDVAEAMEKEGWNVKQLKAREEDEVPPYYVQVTINFKGRPPRIVMITSKGRTPLGEDEVMVLDWADIKTADVILRPYEWAVSGNTGVKAYLQTLFVTIIEDELELKYSDVPDVPDCNLNTRDWTIEEDDE